jgi:hypothetical protein
MLSILYSAIDKNNKPIYGYDTSKSNQESLAKLKAEGLTQIKFYSDALISEKRVDLEGLSPKALAAQAKHDIEMSLNPSFFKHFLFVFTRGENLLRLLVGVSIFLVGLYFDNIWIIGLGIWLFTFVFLNFVLVIIGGYRFITYFHHFYEAISYGEWAKAHKMLNEFYDFQESMLNETKVHFDTVRGLLLAIENPPNVALQKVEEKYGFLKELSPYSYGMMVANRYLLEDIHKRASLLQNIDK